MLVDLISGLLGGWGSKPKVAQYHPLSSGKEQAGAIQGNIQNFPLLQSLGGQYTDYSLGELNKLIPGYSDIMAKGGADTSKLLDVAGQFMTGELPPDVVSQIERSDAYQSFAGGTGGSGMARGLTARDLGLTSIDLMKTGASMLGQGGNSAQQWAKMASGSIYDPANMFVSPQEKSGFDLQNALLRLGTQQEKFNVQAAPDPMLAGLGQWGSTQEGMIMGLLSSVLGSAGKVAGAGV